MAGLVFVFGLIAVVLLVSALASPVVERVPLSFPMIFLGLGVVLGPSGVGLLRLDAHDPLLEAVAVFNLALVLFLDAARLRLNQGRKALVVLFLVLGPGTFLTIALIASGAHVLLGTGLVASLLLGAILASTDPVVLRDVVRDRRIPQPIRDALSIEAGTNDVVVLPIVLVLIAVAAGEAGGAGEWLSLLGRLFVVGPAVGFAIGAIGSWLVFAVDRRMEIRREYQALFGVGLVLAAFAAGQSIADGFLAAFAAGLAVVVFNRELCDCFFEYGEITSETAMLLGFVLFGAVLSVLVPTVPFGPGLAFALVVLCVARPVAITAVLARVPLSWPARAFLSWFGPRGLSSLLLALLVVLSGAAEGEAVLAMTGVVVITSVVLHGASATPVAAWYARLVARRTLPEERESTAAGLFGGKEAAGDEVRRVTPAALAAELAGDHPPVVLDVRSRSQYAQDAGQIPGSVRVPPDEVEVWADEEDARRGDQPTPRRQVVTYCTCPREESAARAARQLRSRGWQTAALLGGYTAWKADFPVEPKPERVARSAA